MMGSGVRVPSAAPVLIKNHMFAQIVRYSLSGLVSRTNDPFDTLENWPKDHEVFRRNTWHGFFREAHLVADEPGKSFGARLVDFNVTI